MIDFLAFAPHPDDAEIGCGGLLLKAKRAGYTTGIVDLSLGECATYGAEERHVERGQATQVLQLDVRDCLNIPDTQIGQSKDQEMQVIEAIREYRPRVLLTPASFDRHPDHEAAYGLLHRAAFLARLGKLGDGEPHRIENIYHYAVHRQLDPTFVLDISDIWPDYMRLLKCYKSQFFNQGKAPETALGGGDYITYIESRARTYGAMINCRYGEGFISKSPLAVFDPASILDRGTGYGSYL